MTDQFLAGLRQAPRAEFAGELKRRLDALDAEGAERAAAPSPWRRLRPALIGVSALVAVVAALSVPAVRASARSLLEVFRVKRFAAVPVDASRMERLRAQEIDLKALLSDQIETLEEPGAPETLSDLAAASERAGFAIAEPSQLPRGAVLSEISVRGGAAIRATLDTEKLAALGQLLEIDDLPIPEGLDGASVGLRTEPAVLLRYTREGAEFRLLQSRSPEVSLPEGLDLPRLGAIGLQLAGMSAEEAEIFARKVDWRSTVLVPVPAAGGDFRDVAVGEAQGLLVTVRPPRSARAGSAARPRPGWRSVLLWSRGERIFALEGPGNGIELIEMASSMGTPSW